MLAHLSLYQILLSPDEEITWSRLDNLHRSILLLKFCTFHTCLVVCTYFTRLALEFLVDIDNLVVRMIYEFSMDITLYYGIFVSRICELLLIPHRSNRVLYDKLFCICKYREYKKIMKMVSTRMSDNNNHNIFSSSQSMYIQMQN